MTFSQKIRQIRRGAFLNQIDFAKNIGVSFATVNRWETGKSIPNLKTMRRIDNYCKCNGIDFDVNAEVEAEKKNDYAGITERI